MAIEVRALIKEDFDLAREVYEALNMSWPIDSVQGKQEHWAIAAKYREFRRRGMDTKSLSDLHNKALGAARRFAAPSSPLYARSAAAWQVWASCALKAIKAASSRELMAS